MDRTELTRTIAYRLFELRGRAHGRHVEDWLVAERLVADVTALAAPAGGATATTAATTAASVARRRGATAALAARDLAPAGLEREALAALAAAVDGQGRAAVAARLGWSSTGPVAALLRGERALGRDLAERIVAALAPGPRPALRVLDGDDGAAARAAS